MVRNIDKVNGIIIQKVTHNSTGALLRYQTIPEGKVGKQQATEFATLKAARDWLGFNNAPKVTEAA